jgi:cytochrome c553
LTRGSQIDARPEGIPSMLRSVVVAAVLIGGAASVSADSIEDKAAICAACHGEKGLPVDPSIPIIWGQNAGYLYLQFRDFQKGARKDDRMTPIAQGVVKEDALAFAEYFAAKPWPSTGAPSASKADAEAAMTAIKSVVCTSCHLAQFQGDSSVPRLAGQEHDYLLKTMMDFRTHARGNNPGMSDLMNTVTPEQVAAIAAYLAGF